MDDIPKDELDMINADIEAAKKNLVSKDTEDKIQRAKEDARKEVEKEFLINQKIKDMEAEKLALQKKLEEKEKASSEELSKLKSKVDELVSSRSTQRIEDPFKRPENQDNLSDEKVSQIEVASAKAFWGEEAYIDMLRD